MGTLLVIILIAQFILSYIILLRLDKGFYFQDIRVAFVSIFALYTLFWPISAELLNFSLDNRAFNLTILSYNLAILAYNIVLITKRSRWLANANISCTQTKRSFLWGIFLLAGLIFYSIYYMYSKGIPIFAFNNIDFERMEYTRNVNQVWVILKFLIAGVGGYLVFYYNQLNLFGKISVIGLLALYIVYQVSLGNRNEYVIIILFILCYWLCKRKRELNIKWLSILLALFAFSFYITIMRSEDSKELKGNEAVQLVAQSNEFMFPIQTTYFTIKDNWELRYGETYVVLPIRTIIPRSLQKDKPESLGSEFISKTFSSGWSGYAYTPVTEAYLNFGIFGPFIIFLLVGLLLNSLVVEVRKKGVTYKYLIAYSIIFNFCRGDASGTIYMILFMWLSYLVMKIIVPNKVSRERVKTVIAG